MDIPLKILFLPIKYFQMKPLLPTKWIFPVGLLLLFSGIAPKNFSLVPDFASGFLIGLGIVLTVGSFIKKWYIKRVE